MLYPTKRFVWRFRQQVDKGEAIAYLLNHLNAPISHTFAFGDAKVDIPMLQYCHIGVAIGNASEEVKAIANYVTADVQQNGLFQAFQHFQLI
ncbi:MAG: HAD hydrolase family protein [Cardiobacteriaceae bacterium]|nr:HAD hydrolase family protein [Cardiobacteriaceae bacterium]